MSSFEFAQQCWEHYKRATISQVISPGETMFNHWYDQVGQSTVRVILGAIAASQLDRADKVMDLPSGHGRALRHLVAMFPAAQFTACDLDRAGVQFCAEEFGATPIVSEPDLAEVQFPDTYDIIWVGSLFTHVSKEQTAAWLAHLAGFLTDKGIIVATFHGRRSISLMTAFRSSPRIRGSGSCAITKPPVTAMPITPRPKTTSSSSTATASRSRARRRSSASLRLSPGCGSSPMSRPAGPTIKTCWCSASRSWARAFRTSIRAGFRILTAA